VELFEQIRREYEHGGGTIRGIAKKLGIGRRLPVLVHEGSRNVWGLRLRRTEQRLALSPLFMLSSAHLQDVGVRVVRFVGNMKPLGKEPTTQIKPLERIEEHETVGWISRQNPLVFRSIVTSLFIELIQNLLTC
jgi:hypothetical protein